MYVDLSLIQTLGFQQASNPETKIVTENIGCVCVLTISV